MSKFWEENPDVGTGGGGSFVNEEEKMELVNSGQVYQITGVERRPNPFEADQEQHVILLQLPDEDGEPEDRQMTFTIGKVESRNRTLDRMAAYFEEDPTPIDAILAKVGRSYLVLPAGADVEAAKAEVKKSKPAVKKSTAKSTAKTAKPKAAPRARRTAARA